LLRTPRGITRHDICAKLEARGYPASRHTFMRDIEHMREDLKAPIGHDIIPSAEERCGHKTHWFYRDQSWTMGQIELTEDTLLSLFVMRETVEQYAGHPLAKELKTVYDKLGESLNRKITLHDDQLAPVSFYPKQSHAIPGKAWSAVLQATRAGKQLEITYNKGWGEESTTAEVRRIHPYHIVNLSGSWYLIGSRDLEDHDVRQYSMERMSAAKVLKGNCEVPADFNIEERLACTFGRFLGDPSQTVEVKVKFNERVAPLIRERARGPREQLRTLPNGDIELTFPASTAGPWPLYDVKSWVLSWGPDAEVIAPPELKELIRDDVKVMMEATATRGMNNA
jgi:predicted DNA-binding transcriptional regulator YafY